MATSGFKSDDVRFADLIDLTNPEKVFAEISRIIRLIFPEARLNSLINAFTDIRNLFAGNYPGYKACNTEYHNLQHTTDTALALSRLIHGAAVEGVGFNEKNLELAIICALMHDVGFIQNLDDNKGTGAKHTKTHVNRSIAFVKKYLGEHGYSSSDYQNAYTILKCTGIDVKLEEIEFSSPEIEMLGKMLGTADLLGQMADRTYLEKLLFLYYEFREGEVGGYISEKDLMEKTMSFFDDTFKRFKESLNGVNEYMAGHFRSSLGLDRDLYKEAIEKNRQYLLHLLTEHPSEYREFLRRGKIVKRLKEKGL
ncbi:MAG: hypothetical protein GX089_09545 [Fibrobacter sp.]|jgi:hypothetical protein|nr:hypothetical protein [Fibrobacter sp.]